MDLADFIAQSESQFYSTYHLKWKQQEFLALVQGDVIMIEYERRFNNLLMFAPPFVSIKHSIIERLWDSLR